MSLSKLFQRGRARMILAVGLVLVAATCKNDPTGLHVGRHEGGHPVLFIGNSLTYTNDLPNVLEQIARQGGDSIDAHYVAFPDYAIIDHIFNGAALDAIKSFDWEYVILQQGPSTVQINRDSLILWSKMIEPNIRAVGAEPALYMVWPDASRISFMDACRVSYQQAAQAVNGVFMPAGYAWAVAWQADATLPLYGGDGFHPSVLGTYLAALVMYERVTGKDARDLPAIAVYSDGSKINVPEATVRLLQASAHTANTTYPAR
jgi:hypothetical protein